MKLSLVTLVGLGGLTIAAILLASSMLETNSHLISNPSAGQPKDLAVEIAKLVTVRILTEPGAGSGVTIARSGQTYTVLTCKHVVADTKSDRTTVLTADGKTHTAYRKTIGYLGDTDLALVQFESKKLYSVATLGDSNSLSPGDRLYASGFPNYYFRSHKNVEDTRNWGMKAFRLTTGAVSIVLKRSLTEGYRLGYTNEVEQGMSGGPVLNAKGQLVGINGRLKYPLQGIDVFRFADGTKPSEKLFEKMEALSWAIPIATFQQKAPFTTYYPTGEFNKDGDSTNHLLKPAPY